MRRSDRPLLQIKLTLDLVAPRRPASTPLADISQLGNLHPMKQKTQAEALAEAAQCSTGNRQEIEASKYAGCLSCCSTFDAKEVVDWRDEWIAAEKQNRVKRWTAKCTRCGKPTVIPSSTGLLEDQAYLPILNDMLTAAAPLWRRKTRQMTTGRFAR
jgi:hypothetical protein